jgi:hypothetical protein
MPPSTDRWPGLLDPSGPQQQQPPLQQPARFFYCTACGTLNAGDARFCDHCGLPMKRQPASATPSPLPTAEASASSSVPADIDGAEPAPMAFSTGGSGLATSSDQLLPLQPSASWPSSPPWTQRWLAPGAALASVLVLALGGVIWYAAAPPPTSQEVLLALRRPGAKVTVPSPDLLCLRNLPYQRHHIQVQPSDQATRNWLDALVKAGLYAPAVEVIPEGLSRDTLLQYQSLPAITLWRRGGRLCVAQNWVLDAVAPNSIRKDTSVQPPRYVASLVWRAEGVAPWLALVPEAGVRLAGVRVEDGVLTTKTVEGVER